MKETEKLTTSKPGKILMIALVLLFGAVAFACGMRYNHNSSLQLASGTQLEASRKTIIKEFLPANSINCADSSDPTSPTDRVYVFFQYMRINRYDNRAVIRGCNNTDQVLMKAKTGQWIQTSVNLNLDKQANPDWQKACLIDDITVADSVVRPENKSIDETNLSECNYMLQNGMDESSN